MRRAAVGVVALLLACPLFWLPGTGFDALRLPAVLVLAAALLGLSFLRSARGAERPPGPAPLRTAGAILLGAHVLSLLSSRSIADGAVPILILAAGLAVFSALRAGVIRPPAAASLVPVVSGVAAVFSAIGIVQWFSGQEAVSTEGNRNYTGALAGMLVPAVVAFTRTGPGWSRALSAVASASTLALLLMTQSRGGLLAALAGLTLAAVALGVKKVDRGLAAAGGAILALVAVAVIFQGTRQLSPDRLKTAAFRLEVWDSGLAMLKQKPLLGWGAGGFSVEYPPFRSESEFRVSHAHPPEGFRELEDAHSSWVETAVDAGIPGLLALLLVAYVAARLWRYDVKIATDDGTVAMLAGLGGAAAAYLVAGLFNTLTLKTSHTVLFWACLGLMELAGERRPWRSAGRAQEWRVAAPAAAAIALFFGALWAGSLAMAQAAYDEGMLQPDPRIREPRLREALDANPFHWRARYELVVTLSALGRFPAAVEEGRVLLRQRPHHLEALNRTAIAIHQLGGDGKEPEAMLRRAMEIAPYYDRTRFNLGILYLQLGRRAEAREQLTKCLEINPRHALAYYRRGSASLSGGDWGPALEDFRQARALGFDVRSALKAEQPTAENDPRLAELFR